MDRLDDELDSLRLRAYGPDADIWSDAAALARLGELEAHAHRSVALDDARWDGRSSPPGPAGADVVTSAPHDALEELFRVSAEADEPSAAEHARARADAEGVAAPAADAALSPDPDPHPDPDAQNAGAALIPIGGVPSAADAGPTSAPVAPVLSRRARVAWLATLAAAVILAAGVTAWLYPYGVRDGLHHDARLQVQSEGASEEVIAQLGATDPTNVRYFGDYKGLPIYATTDCLQAVMDPEQGVVYGGCAVDGIDPILDLYVPGTGQADTSYTDTQFPRELTRDFPDGGLVRFQLDGDEVLVDEGRHPKQA